MKAYKITYNSPKHGCEGEAIIGANSVKQAKKSFEESEIYQGLEILKIESEETFAEQFERETLEAIKEEARGFGAMIEALDRERKEKENDWMN